MTDEHKLEWREKLVIRVLFLIAKIAGRNLPEALTKEIQSLETNVILYG